MSELMDYTIQNLRKEIIGDPPREVWYANLINEEQSTFVMLLQSIGAENVIWDQETDIIHPIRETASNPKPLSQYRDGDVICLETPLPGR